MMKVVLATAVLCLGSLAALAQPPELSRVDQAQLQDAHDFTRDWDDEPALLPLVRNAIWWDKEDKQGAHAPDYAALLKSPQEYRGQFFIVKGRLVKIEENKRLQTPGPWNPPLAIPGVTATSPYANGRIQQYALLVDGLPDAVALVLLVDPPAKGPLLKSEIEIPARFFKIRKDMAYSTSVTQSGVKQVDPTGTPDTLFPIFVGKGVIGWPKPVAAGNALATPYDFFTRENAALLFVLAAAAGVTFLLMRRRLARAVSGAVSKETLQVARDRVAINRRADPTLPKDPAAALAELEKRGQGE
jgi:hypothetical protein